MTAPELSTERTLLRHWRDADKKPFRKLNSDPEVMACFPSPLTAQESDALAKRCERELQEKPYGLWALEVPGVAPFIGFVGLHYHDFEAPFTPCIEIGWRLDKAYWGQGYAFEAAQKALTYGRELPIPEIVSFTAEINARSIHLMKKLGLKYESTFMHPKLPKGDRLEKHVLYSTG